MFRQTLQVFLIALAALIVLELAARFARRAPPEPLVALEVRDLQLPTPPRQPEPPPSPTPPPKLRPPAPPPAAPPPPAPTPTPSPLSQLLPPLPLQLVEPKLSDRELYERLSPAIIQIFCATPEELSTASAAIVNERGLVLTNAHVAEIVRGAGEANCQARRGSPADPFAKIQILYVADTSEKIPDTKIAQRDFAFLRLVEPKAAFGVAAVSLAEAAEGETLLTLGYPSEFLASIAASANSNLVFSTLRVDGLADLDGERATAEGYVSKGGLVLQQGSSGTALFRRDGMIVGLIFATTKGATTAEREGIALTTAFIDRALKRETKEGLLEFIAGH